ncbi:MAG: F-type H+-transporting ATPase subunit b [Actinomycetota bacterium]|jgi:F-type H+-transporting ATPase subunit b|nr:F-type H+-transporting ATPase subunit b [Actinomycetota bacterium]
MSLTILALQLAAKDEPSPLFPHPSELIVGLVAFTLLFLFLRAKVFPMFEKVYSERHEAIEGGLERAKKAEEEAEAALAQYREQLAEARHEASRLREDAREQGAAIIVEMREQAQSEARRITELAHQQLEADKQQAINQLRTQVGSLAVELASRIIGEALQDDSRQRRVVDRFLEEIESGSGDSADSAGAGASASGPGTPAGSGKSGGDKA